MSLFKIILYSNLVLAATQCASFASPKTPVHSGVLSVVPGKSLGKVNVGWTPAQVRKALGKADKTMTLSGGLRDDIYRAKSSRTDQNGTAVRDKVEILYRRGRVVQIEATSPQFVAPGNLSTASMVRQITSSRYHWRVLVYGYEHADSSWQNYYLMDQKKGLSFEFQGWQEQMMWRSYPTTIIVHQPGTRAIPDAGGKLVTDSTDLSVVMSQYD